MYAHQVIEDILKNKINAPFVEQSKKDSILIKKSFMFHIEDANQIFELFKKEKGNRAFYGSMSKYIKLPFDNICIDWERASISGLQNNTERVDIYHDPPVNSSKSLVLVSKICEHNFYIKIFSYLDKYKSFAAPQYSLIVHNGSNFGETKEGTEIIDSLCKETKINEHFKKQENAFPIPTNFLLKTYQNNYNELTELIKKLIKEDAGEISMVSFLLTILNCKNVSTIKNFPPKKLNKKRAMFNKQPLFTYHTLVVNPAGVKNGKVNPHENTGIKQRLHFCRGHFKEYTAEKPLFGRLTGLYWWQPMVRGNKELGIVYKDYEVRAA